MPCQFKYSKENRQGKEYHNKRNYIMTRGFLEGLIKPTVDTDIDMSTKINNTYNIGTYVDRVEKIEIKIDVHVALPAEQVNSVTATTAHDQEKPQE